MTLLRLLRLRLLLPLLLTAPALAQEGKAVGPNPPAGLFTVNGALAGNGSGTISQAACANLSNGATGCSTATGTSGATLPLLNGTNTWSGKQTISGNFTDGLSVLGGSGSNAGISVGRTAAEGYYLVVGGNAQFNPATLTGDIIARGSSRLLLDGSGGATNAIIVSTTNTLTLSTVASDAAQTDNSLCINSAGLVLKGSGTLGICLGTSSRRFKNHIVPMIEGLEKLAALQPKNFYYNKGHGDDGAREQYGFVAEDVVTVLPKLVPVDGDGRPNSVDMVGMIPIIVRGMQQLQADNDNLRARIDALENRRFERVRMP